MLRLRHRQQECLAVLYQRQGWHPGCGWIWNNRSVTIAIMDSLVKAGTAVKSGKEDTPRYVISPVGLDYLKIIRPYLFRFSRPLSSEE